MKKIIVSAPGKLMLFGEHAVTYGKPCLVTAVNQRMRLMAESLDIPELHLEASDVDVSGYKKLTSEAGVGDIPKGARFVEIAVRNFMEKIKIPKPPLLKGEKEDHMGFPSLLKRGQGGFIKGLKITTKSDFSSEFGFGSSSAAVVCTIKALSELFGVKLTSKEIFDLSYKTILDIQGKGSGFDVAAAVYGGTLYFVTGGKAIEQLTIDNLPLIVGYSGVKADTVALLDKVKESFTNRQERLQEIYRSIESLVDSAKIAIVKKDWKTLGGLMNKNQDYLRELGVSTEKLDAMITSAIKTGAYGAKLSGAGGGDCIIALADEKKRESVESAITKAGGEIIHVNTNAEGVIVEKKRFQLL